MFESIVQQWLRYSLDVFQIDKSYFNCCRMFEINGTYPVVFIFQKPLSLQHYISVMNTENPKFEILKTFYSETDGKHIKTDIPSLKATIGKDILFHLIKKKGLFFNDEYGKRNTDKKIIEFIEDGTSGVQIQRLVSTIAYPVSCEYKQIHHLDLQPQNCLYKNLCPLTVPEHIGKENSVHFFNGIRRNKEDVIRIGFEKYKEFLNSIAI